MDVTLADLWLPILLSAVFVFIASSVIHMALPIHRKDYAGLPGEDAVLEAMRAQNVGPGDYMFPHCESFKAMNEPEYKAKLESGPVGTMTVVPGFAMGKALVQWFVYSVVVSVFVAYVLTFACAKDADYMVVFRLAGTVGFMSYALGTVPNSIWKGLNWGTTAKFVVDGLIYGLVTAGTFGWQWPSLMG